MHRRMAIVAGVLLAGAAGAATGQQREFDRILAGKQAGAPQRCIIPDRSANPVVLDGQAIAYFVGRTVYVNHFGRNGCAPLRQTRTLITVGVGGRLCRNDPARVIEPPGNIGYGFCTMGDFIPYSKIRP